MNNKNYFVTGVSSGIGEEIVREIVASGGNVFGVARRAERLESIQQSLSEAPGNFYFSSGDITDDHFLKSSLRRIVNL